MHDTNYKYEKFAYCIQHNEMSESIAECLARRVAFSKHAHKCKTHPLFVRMLEKVGLPISVRATPDLF